MKVTGKSGKEYIARAVKDEKVPKRKGDKYKTKQIKVNGTSQEFFFNPEKKVGAYTVFGGKNLYFQDQTVTDESALTITEREKKEKAPKKAKAAAAGADGAAPAGTNFKKGGKGKKTIAPKGEE